MGGMKLVLQPVGDDAVDATPDLRVASVSRLALGVRLGKRTVMTAVACGLRVVLFGKRPLRRP